MKNHFGRLLNGWRTILLATTGVVTLVIFVAGMPAAAQLRAQSAADSASSTDRPKFDAISIKINKTPGVGVGRINLAQAGGHVTASNVSLKFLIGQGYQPAPLHSGPNPKGAEWIETEHFEIEAEAEGNPTIEQKRLMIQSLLADRFKLVIHHETRELPEFALVLSKDGKVGPQLKPHTEETKCVEVPAGRPNPPIVPGAPLLAPCGGLRVAGSDLAGQNMKLEKLAGALSVLMDREVVNRTGLDGSYDVTLHFQIVSLDAEASAPDPLAPPSIYTALQEQLGLKLESTKGPVDVTIIDHVEQPSEN